jgi:hypothetical protein
MRKITLTLSIALIVTTAATCWLWRGLETERARTAELTARLDVLVGPHMPIATARSAESHAPPEVTQVSAPRAPTSETAVSDGEEDYLVRQRRLMEDPKYLDAYRTTRRTQLAGWRQDAIRLLGFSPKEADAVIALVVERQIGAMTAPTPVMDMTPESMQLARERTEADERAYQDRIRAAIGEEKRARWEVFRDSMSSRRRVDNLRAQLPESDALRGDQVEPLIAALHTESAQYQRDLRELGETLAAEPPSPEQTRRYFERKMEMLEATQHRQHEAASGILSATQLRLLDEGMQHELDNELADQRAALIAEKLDQSEPH